MKKAIIILGAGVEQLDSYKFCKNLKVTTIGVDKNPLAEGLNHSNFKVNESIYKPDQIIKKIKKIKNIKVVGVVAVGVDCPKTLKELSKTFKLNTLKESIYNKVSTKIKTYNSLKKFGIIPYFQIIKKKRIFYYL